MSKTRPGSVPWLRTNEIMLAADFSTAKIRESQIWAARHRKCSKCGAAPYTPCKNLNQVAKVGFEKAAACRYPHPDRIDYELLYRKLRDRGYCD